MKVACCLFLVLATIASPVLSQTQKRDVLGVSTGMTDTEAVEAAVAHDGKCLREDKSIKCKFPDENILTIYFSDDRLVHTLNYEFPYPYTDSQIAEIVGSTYGLPRERDGTYDFQRRLASGEFFSFLPIHGYAAIQIIGLPHAIPQKPKF